MTVAGDGLTIHLQSTFHEVTGVAWAKQMTVVVQGIHR